MDPLIDESKNNELKNENDNGSPVSIQHLSTEEKSSSDIDNSLDTVAIQQEVTQTKIAKGRARSATITNSNKPPMIVKKEVDKQETVLAKEEDKGDTKELVDSLQQIEEASDSDESFEDSKSHNHNNNNSSTSFTNHDAEEIKKPLEKEPITEDVDWEFWSKVISDFHGVSKSEAKVLSFQIQKGIPFSLRGMVWQLFSKSKNVDLESQYMQLLKEESVYEKAITRDLPKLKNLNEEHQKEALFNIMKAFSLYDKDVGYSPSLLYIATPLLLNMPEEEAFCVLVQLMNKYGLRGHFLPQEGLISRRLYQLSGLLGDHLPHLHRHFELHGIKSDTYANQWFNTLFAYKFPLETVYHSL
ncbi:rab-GTPase-TBC domain-containing protein [Sporodiniella umbellata]|nr:rab-GTPase-TBC domain-containing protein [Sporodiniella umbellata]